MTAGVARAGLAWTWIQAWWRTTLLRPPGWMFDSLYLLALAWTIGRSSEGASGVRVLLTWLPVWAALGSLWLIRLIVHFGMGGDDPMPARARARWAVAPAIGLLAAAVAFSGVAFSVRFAASEGALRALAESARAGTPVEPGWHGLYEVRRVRVSDGDVWIRIRGGTRLLWVGTGPGARKLSRGTWSPAPGWAVVLPSYD